MGPREFNSFSYLLFLLAVIGAFASVAQNDYGVLILAIACFGFSTVFMIRLIGIMTTESTIYPSGWIWQEYLLMSLVMLLFGLRALLIRFVFVEIVFVVLSVLLMLVYWRYLTHKRKKYGGSKNLQLSSSILYLSIILFFGSLALSIASFTLSTVLGVLSFLGLLFFFYRFMWRNPVAIYKQEKISISGELFQYKNLSPIIVTIIIMMSLYMGLFMAKLIPPLYTGELPVKYVELQNLTSDEEQLIDGVPKHEVYWKEYEEFLQFMQKRDQKDPSGD